MLLDTALQRLAVLSSRRGVPLVRQIGINDSGAAALTMVLRYFDKNIELTDVREVLTHDREGIDTEAIIRAARSFGLRGRTISVDIETLEHLTTGAILYWRFQHFVVFERLRSKYIEIVDPAVGQRSIPLDEFRRSFTGAAILFEPTGSFTAGQKKIRPRYRWLSQILSSWPMLARIASTSLLAQIAAALVPLLTWLVIDQVVPHSDGPLLLELCVGYCLFQAFGVFAMFVRAHLFNYFRAQLEAMFTLRFLDHLIELPYLFFQEHTAGDLMVRLGSNNAVRDILTSTAMSTLLDGGMAALYFVLLLIISTKLTLFVSVLAIARFSLLAVIRWQQKLILNETIDNQSRIQTYQVEMLAGMETLKAMGLEVQAAERWTNVFVDGLNIGIRRGRLEAALAGMLSLLESANALIFLFYGAFMVLQNQLTLGSMVAASALAAGFLGPLNNLVGTILQLQIIETYIERIDDVLDTLPERQTQSTSSLRTFRGDVALDRATFRYRTDGPIVIDNVSLHVPSGQHVAIVGPSGSGKSTLARLIGGLCDPTYGTVLYDGHDLKSLDLRSIRQHIGVVTQDIQLFSGSVRKNISLSNQGMEFAQVINAAKNAYIHDEILKMPMGYDTILGDRGLSLSGGQRQRLALARALAGSPVLLIMDEATSHLDLLAEEQVNRNLMATRCTRIVIAHRLSTVRTANLIFVVDAGRIVESGTHQQLMALGRKYYEMFAGEQENT
jgi:ATP-binding cassette, subfamily B, bacterial